MLLTLTWCHCSPADPPTKSFNIVISSEHQVDDIASAYDGGRQGGADTLATNPSALRGVAAAFLHQSCPVAVRDCQMVPETGGTVFDVKCSES